LIGEVTASTFDLFLGHIDTRGRRERGCLITIPPLSGLSNTIALLLDGRRGRLPLLLLLVSALLFDAAGSISIGGGGAATAGAVGFRLGLLAMVSLGLGDLGHLCQ